MSADNRHVGPYEYMEGIKDYPAPKEMNYDRFMAMVALSRKGSRFVDRYEVGDVITLHTNDGRVFKKKVVQEKFFKDL